MKLLIIAVAATLLSACSPSENNGSSEDAPKKLSIVLSHDNSYSTFLKCSSSGTTFDCSGQPQVVPTFGSMEGLVDIEQSAMDKIANMADGCYSEVPTGEASPMLISMLDNNKCRYRYQLFRGETSQTGSKMTEWSALNGASFSGSFPYLAKYTFAAVDTDFNDQCTRRYLYQERPTYSQFTKEFTLSPGSITFSSLFSLQLAPTMSGVTTATRNAEFNIDYIPAVNTQELIDGGATTDNILDLLTPHLGDFILLSITDSRGKKAFCKKADAIEGTLTVPASVMQKLYGNTSFVLTRYKIIKKQLSPNAELVVNLRVNQYTTGTDAYGQTNGKLIVNIQ